MAFFTDAIICQHFLQETQVLHIFVRLKTLVLFFICFLAFCEFQCLLYKNTFFLTFIMGISYFVLACRRLKTIKLNKVCFSTNLQCLFLCLISIQEKPSKLYQVPVITLPYCQLLHQVSENAILYPIMF